MRQSKSTLRALLAQVEAERDRAHERVAELEDRLDARSLSEFRAWHDVAMPVLEEEPRGNYISDPTGLFTIPVPKSE